MNNVLTISDTTKLLWILTEGIAAECRKRTQFRDSDIHFLVTCVGRIDVTRNADCDLADEDAYIGMILVKNWDDMTVETNRCTTPELEAWLLSLLDLVASS